jgi:DNA-directed RNA polymerase subunit RPC12/RpoP
MSGEQDDIMVICVAWSAKNMRLSPGSRQDRCATCRRRIVVSPVGQKLEADPGFEKRYLCIRCAQAEAPDAHVGPAPGALEEAAKRIGMENAIAIGSMAKRTRLGDFRPEEIDGE